MRAGCLKDLQRFLRNDDPDLRTVFFKLCRFETAKTDLVPLLKACAGEKDMVFNTRAQGYMGCRVACVLQPQPQLAPASCSSSALNVSLVTWVQRVQWGETHMRSPSCCPALFLPPVPVSCQSRC